MQEQEFPVFPTQLNVSGRIQLSRLIQDWPENKFKDFALLISLLILRLSKIITDLIISG